MLAYFFECSQHLSDHLNPFSCSLHVPRPSKTFFRDLFVLLLDILIPIAHPGAKKTSSDKADTAIDNWDVRLLSPLEGCFYDDMRLK